MSCQVLARAVADGVLCGVLVVPDLGANVLVEEELGGDVGHEVVVVRDARRRHAERARELREDRVAHARRTTTRKTEHAGRYFLKSNRIVRHEAGHSPKRERELGVSLLSRISQKRELCYRKRATDACFIKRETQRW